jgi:hypothetical protein
VVRQWRGRRDRIEADGAALTTVTSFPRPTDSAQTAIQPEINVSQLKTVMVVIRSLPPHTVLRIADVDVREVPQDLLEPDAAMSQQDVLCKRLWVPLAAGQQVHGHGYDAAGHANSHAAELQALPAR